jgi:hypothetical protein
MQTPHAVFTYEINGGQTTASPSSRLFFENEPLVKNPGTNWEFFCVVDNYRSPRQCWQQSKIYSYKMNSFLFFFISIFLACSSCCTICTMTSSITGSCPSACGCNCGCGGMGGCCGCGDCGCTIAYYDCSQIWEEVQLSLNTF